MVVLLWQIGTEEVEVTTSGYIGAFRTDGRCPESRILIGWCPDVSAKSRAPGFWKSLSGLSSIRKSVMHMGHSARSNQIPTEQHLVLVSTC